MIPENIKRIHIISAIEKYDHEGTSSNHQSKKFDLIYKNKKYPPKVIISFANIFANNNEFSTDDFKGGLESISFLQRRGFQIIEKGCCCHTHIQVIRGLY